MKAVPGRKKNIKDAELISKLLRHGLLKARYIQNGNYVNLFAIVGEMILKFVWNTC